jgi:two-component system sensor histidine kinase UhpB
MDLRVRLLVFLSGASLALLVAAALVIGSNLRDDVADELAASTRLVELMLSISEARERGSGEVERLLAGDELRHVQVALDRSESEQSLPSGTADGATSLVERLSGVDRALLGARRIELGNGEAIVMRADPGSEVREIVSDAARMLAVLAVFALGAVGAAWYAADRALRPVRALEDGLQRLARGELRPGLPPFELREFCRIAASIDHLADALACARANERRLARCVLELQESERRELARELHDEFGQSLTAIGAGAAFVERHAGGADPAALAECARDIRSESGRMAAHVRGLLRQLRPHGLEGLGMRDALREVIDAWRMRAPQVTVDAELPPSLPPLSAAAGLALYRTLQEALTNVLRHAGASRVSVRLAVEPGGLVLVVADDGCGRAAEVLRNARGGLLGMRERADMAGGALEPGNSPLGGLCITLRLPIDHHDHGEVHDDPDSVAR